MNMSKIDATKRKRKQRKRDYTAGLVHIRLKAKRKHNDFLLEFAKIMNDGRKVEIIVLQDERG